MYRILSSIENFIQRRQFYPVRRLLSSVENFIQCRDFYPVRRILFNAENSIQWVDLYQSCQNNSKKSYTEKKNKHTPSCYLLFTNCSFDSAELHSAKSKLDCYRDKKTNMAIKYEKRKCYH